MEKLEQRLAEIEKSTELMPAVIQGVQELLRQMDSDPSAGKGPDLATVYSVPIAGNPFLGPKHAKVTMVKAYDYYCGYCNSVRPTLAQLRKEYGDDLKIVFKDFVIHEDTARLPALASCAAHLQGKFFDAFELIWKQGLEARSELDQKKLLGIAKTLNLEIAKFQSDMNGACKNIVRKNQAQLASVGTTGTPAFYVNGRFLGGARPIEHFRILVDEELAKANKAIKGGTNLRDYYSTLVKQGKTTL